MFGKNLSLERSTQGNKSSKSKYIPTRLFKVKDRDRPTRHKGLEKIMQPPNRGQKLAGKY